MQNKPKHKTDTPSHFGVNSVHAGEGAPVILVHGLAASLHDWDDLVPALAKVDYSAYALDLLGHGESLKPPHLGDYSGDTVYGHMKGWLDTLSPDQPLIMIGHSLGGYLCMRYALENPDLVRGLILVNPLYALAQLPGSLRLIFKQPLLNTAVIERTPYWLFRLLIDLSSLQFGNGNGTTHTLPEKVRQQTALDYMRAASGIYNIPRTLPKIAPDLSRLIHPVLVLWGKRDQTLDPKSFSQLVDALPNAHGESLAACGHVPHQCHPSVFNHKVMEFLRTI
jgi:pimeloyl-ACP methyl ester carboxylesterase